MKHSVPENGGGNDPVAAAGESEGLRLLLAEREDAIRDLRHRLDLADARLAGEIEERRRAQERLTALLTHRQPDSVPTAGAPVSADRRPWWRWWR
jgi:hypothetical protein